MGLNLDKVVGDILGDASSLVFYDNLSITLLQKALKSKGYDPGDVDGKWGPATKKAVAKFLADQGESDHPAVPDYHVLSSLGISPNNDMMSAATKAQYKPTASKASATASDDKPAVPVEASGWGSSVLETLKRPVGPLPVWAWGLIAVKVGLIYYLINRPKSTASTPTAQPAGHPA